MTTSYLNPSIHLESNNPKIPAELPIKNKKKWKNEKKEKKVKNMIEAPSTKGRGQVLYVIEIYDNPSNTHTATPTPCRFQIDF